MMATSLTWCGTAPLGDEGFLLFTFPQPIAPVSGQMRELGIKERKSCPQTKSNNKLLHTKVSKLVTWIFFFYVVLLGLFLIKSSLKAFFIQTCQDTCALSLA